MKWSNVRWIFLREVRDQLRDRRTLFTIAVLPLLLYPLLGIGFLQMAQFSREHPTSILIVGADALPSAPRLVDRGQFSEQFCPPKEARLLQLTARDHDDSADPERVREAAENMVQAGQYNAVVYFPPDFATRLEDFRRELQTQAAGDQNAKQEKSTLEIPQPRIFADTASDKSRMARDRVARVLRAWRSSIVQQNLEQSRVPAGVTEPFDVVNTDVARAHRRRAAIWSKVLPFVVLVWALTGAFYPAIDLCAGEKERGTLETLLCSPAQRSEIVWGKLLTIMAFSMGTSLLNLLSMGTTGALIMLQLSELDTVASHMGIGLPPFAATGWIVLALIPIAGLFSALSLAIASFARSSKEGQYYLMPLLLVTLPLMMLPMLPGAELDLGTSLVPVSGMMFLLRSLIEGQYMESLRYAVPVIGITSICCLLAIRWAIDQFNNESVLFRESERWGLGLWIRHVVRDRGETPSLAEALLCGVLLLMIRFFASFLVDPPASWPQFATSTVVTLIAFIAAPALLMTVMLTRRPRKTLLLRMPRPAAIPMAILLAIVIHPAGVAFAEGIKALYPFSHEMLEQMERMGAMVEQAPSIWSILAVLALTPAICEELAFRGFILSGMRRLGHKWAAIFATSVFFGAAHGVLQQSLTACAVGMVIGYVAIQTSSLLPALLFHVVYNSLTLVMSTVVGEFAERYRVIGWFYAGPEDVMLYPWPVVVASLLLAAAVLAWFRRLPYELTPEESLRQALGHQGAMEPQAARPAPAVD